MGGLVTTIRAATPMYLMCRKIKASGIKMVLSGEGADEIFGGYLYAPRVVIAILHWVYHSWIARIVTESVRAGTFTRPPARRSFTPRPCGSSTTCTTTTACAPTNRPWPGVLRRACHSWTKVFYSSLDICCGTPGELGTYCGLFALVYVEFLDYAMSLDPVHKMCGLHAEGRIEKWCVREAVLCSAGGASVLLGWQ
jgi:hypothetical protein